MGCETKLSREFKSSLADQGVVFPPSRAERGKDGGGNRVGGEMDRAVAQHHLCSARMIAPHLAPLLDVDRTGLVENVHAVGPLAVGR